MAGDVSNARIWTDADVWVSFDLDTVNPTDIDDDFGAGWDLVGLLDGDEGFTEARAEDESDFFAWGGIVIATSRKNFKLTRTFTAFEFNDTTRRLRWPGSDAGQIVVPRPERVKMAWETRTAEVTHRLIAANYVEVVPNGDVKESESAPSPQPFIATVFPDASESPAVLFIEQSTPES